jgi:single-strand DNA-binding protein
MANLNKFMAIGRLTRDVELRVTPKGTAIAQFGMAINRSWKDESGQNREEICFIDCEAWGKTAELCSKYLEKGSQVFIESHLKLDSWDDKASGQKRSKLKVVVNNVQFLDAAPLHEESQRPRVPPVPHATPPNPNPRPGPDGSVALEDDDFKPPF